MTADGELYVDEVCRDVFEKELDEAFGKGQWRLDGTAYCNVWDMDLFPLDADVLVLSADYHEIIGKVVITSRPEVVMDALNHRMISLNPETIRITTMEVK